jgi:hypothetical protein
VALQTAPRDHELAHQVHQRVQAVEADTDARASSPRGVARRPASHRGAGGRLCFGLGALDSGGRFEVLRRLDRGRGRRQRARGRVGGLRRERRHARLRIDGRRLERRQRVEETERPLVSGRACIRALLAAPHEKTKRVEAGEHRLDRGAIERAPLLADLARACPPGDARGRRSSRIRRCTRRP